MKKHCPDYPDTKFALIDGVSDAGDNVVSTLFAQNEGSFLAGAAAAMLTTKTDIPGINDKKMEELVASVFKDFMDCEIKLVGKSHDGGKDLILLNGENQTFVQVKRRTQANKVEGVSCIRDLIGASIIGDAKACVFVTTANHFSKPAQDAAKKVVEENILDSFELIDYQRFVDMLNLQRESYPKEWEGLLRIKDNENII